MADPGISVQGLRKSYDGFEAVRGIDLEIRAGEIFAFLGPNGAGKTTTVEILEGYRRRDAGEVAVLGSDPAGADRRWRGRIGMVLQERHVPQYLTVREALAQFAGYYPRPRPVDEVIALVGLNGRADTRTERLSGGQQRRLDVGMALVGDPETVFLTTHYMDEAQQLADRVAIIARGEIVAEGTPDQLGERETRPSAISFRLPAEIQASELPAELGAATAVANGALTVEVADPVPALHALTGWAIERGVRLEA